MPWGDFENLGKKIQFWVKTCSYRINNELYKKKFCSLFVPRYVIQNKSRVAFGDSSIDVHRLSVGIISLHTPQTKGSR